MDFDKPCTDHTCDEFERGIREVLDFEFLLKSGPILRLIYLSLSDDEGGITVTCMTDTLLGGDLEVT